MVLRHWLVELYDRRTSGPDDHSLFNVVKFLLNRWPPDLDFTRCQFWFSNVNKILNDRWLSFVFGYWYLSDSRNVVDCGHDWGCVMGYWCSSVLGDRRSILNRCWSQSLLKESSVSVSYRRRRISIMEMGRDCRNRRCVSSVRNSGRVWIWHLN